jgi:4-hydroxy-3-methylbut-2-enyl diphosphate reductase IspH
MEGASSLVAKGALSQEMYESFKKIGVCLSTKTPDMITQDIIEHFNGAYELFEQDKTRDLGRKIGEIAKILCSKYDST